MSEFDAQRYLNRCSTSTMMSLERITHWGVVAVLGMAALDLVLTMAKISGGTFVDANPLAQLFIENGIAWGLIIVKIGAATFFGYVCLKHLDLTTTQVGVGLAAFAHILLMFHWVLVF